MPNFRGLGVNFGNLVGLVELSMANVNSYPNLEVDVLRNQVCCTNFQFN